MHPQSLYQNSRRTKAGYPPVQLGVETLARAASKPETIQEVISVLDQLTPDDYIRFLSGYLSEGSRKFGGDWVYLDIMNVLLAASRLIRPRRYLEIGIRRGRSLALVSAGNPEVDITGFDMWMRNYAGMENPGADFVTAELNRLGHRGSLELISGNSHETVPAFFRQHPDAVFDMITVDGDHSDKGAMADLADVLPHLAVGGMVFFDDILHPEHPNLIHVWRKSIGKARGRFASKEYTDLGYGVAFAIRLE
jgi:predicted O-methyltransferase YrrM